MLTSIHLKNFKALRDVTVEFGSRFTVLIGANSTGKSSVLQAIALMKQSSGQASLILTGDEVQCASGDLVTHGSTDERMEIGLQGMGTDFGLFESTRFDVVHQFQRHNVALVDLELNADNHSVRLRSDGDSDQDLKWGNINLRPTNLGKTILPPIVLRVIDTDQNKKYQRMFDILGRIHVDAVRNTFFIPPIRGFSNVVHTQLANYENNFSDPDNLATMLSLRVEDIAETASTLLEAVTDIRVVSRTRPNHKLELVADSNKGSGNLISEGFGTNQLVHMLSVLAQASPSAHIMIDEPEIHLHPKSQRRLVDQVLMPISEARQLIFTTHSEHMLFALLNQVARGELDSDSDLRVWYFERDTNGEVIANRVEVTSEGMAVGGLPGFFEADLESAEEFLEAIRIKGSGANE